MSDIIEALQNQRNGLYKEIQKLDNYSQSCLQGLLDKSQNFNRVAPSLSESDRKSFFDQTEKSSMAQTYEYLLSNHIREKTIKKAKAVEQQLESLKDPLASQEEN